MSRGAPASLVIAGGGGGGMLLKISSRLLSSSSSPGVSELLKAGQGRRGKSLR
jgi:hypothetical protein